MAILVRAQENLALNKLGIQEFDLEPKLLKRTLEFDAQKQNVKSTLFGNLGLSITTFYIPVAKILTPENHVSKNKLRLKEVHLWSNPLKSVVGIKNNPTEYRWSKYERSLVSGCQVVDM